MKGAAQAVEEFAHAAAREPSTEGLLDPVAHLGGRLEAAGGDFAFEEVELRRLESARVALVLQGAEGVQTAALVEIEPVADRAWTDTEQGSNLLRGLALVQPQQGGQAVMNADVFLVAAFFFDLLAQQGIQSETSRRVLQGSFSSAAGEVPSYSCYSEEKLEDRQYITSARKLLTELM
jgi:hypothetical protein